VFWKDYAIEVDVFNAPYGAFPTATGGIIVRAQDDLNKVLLMWMGNSHMCWKVIIDGEETECMETVRPGLTAKARVRVEVIGNTYVAYVRQGDEGDLVMRSQFENDRFPYGMPGLALRGAGEQAFDNFKVISR